MALTLVIILIFGIGLYAGWHYANNSSTTNSSNAPTSSSSTNINTVPDASTIQGQQEAAIAIIEPSVVELDVTLAQGEAIGSGVIIDKNGDIVTNNHVVSGAQTIKVVLNNGKTETAQVVGTSAANDLAIVHIQPFANMAVATIGDSSKLVVGQEVLAVGNPLGITQTATRGIVSALNRSIQEPSDTNNPNQAGATINKAIQTDAPINPGNSGGALINLQGELIGIPTLAAINTESNTDANGIGFAIPSSTVQATITQILNQ
jgi:S1-C subfamily serine protease